MGTDRIAGPYSITPRDPGRRADGSTPRVTGVPPNRTAIVPEDDPATLVELIETLTRRATGWINAQPEIPADVEVPGTPGPLAVFSKRGPAVPLATWTAPHVIERSTRSGRPPRREPSQIGLQHGAGTRAVDRLADSPVPVPEEWYVLSDHPKRGLVAVPPHDTAPADLGDWISRVLAELCRVPRSGRLVLHVYESRP